MISPKLIPVWELLTPQTQQRLIKWQARHYPKFPLRPAVKIELMEFDPAKEMSLKPEYSEHMRG